MFKGLYGAINRYITITTTLYFFVINQLKLLSRKGFGDCLIQKYRNIVNKKSNNFELKIKLFHQFLFCK